MSIKINLAKLHAIGADMISLGLFSNVQNFGSGWRVAFDHGGFLLIEGEAADGSTKMANISRDCLA